MSLAPSSVKRQRGKDSVDETSRKRSRSPGAVTDSAGTTHPSRQEILQGTPETKQDQNAINFGVILLHGLVGMRQISVKEKADDMSVLYARWLQEDQRLYPLLRHVALGSEKAGVDSATLKEIQALIDQKQNKEEKQKHESVVDSVAMQSNLSHEGYCKNVLIFLSATERAWGIKFAGNSLARLLARVEDIAKTDEGVYSKILPIVQSSGMGKSRTVHELATEIFTIPICLRESKDS
ncbi:hypothetical protein CPC08DRAFT_754966, partial [Agrocybe pediades]